MAFFVCWGADCLTMSWLTPCQRGVRMNLTRGAWGLAPDVMAEPCQRGVRMNLTREPWGLVPDVMAEPYQRGERMNSPESRGDLHTMSVLNLARGASE